MGQNGKIVEAFYAAMGRGDIAAAIGLFHPRIVWNEAHNFVYADGNPYVGPDAVLKGVFARLGSEWDRFSAAPDQVVDGGDTVVSLGRYRGVYKATGAKVDAAYAHVFTFEDGKIATFQQYTDTAQFRDAVTRGAAA